MRSAPATARSRARCGQSLWPDRRSGTCRSATSPTACTTRPGWARRCASCWTATSAPTGCTAPPTRGSWAAVDGISDQELWDVRERQRAELVSFVAQRSLADRLARGDSREYVEAAARCFDPHVLTIGFARRVATYKRLELLMRDPDWTLSLLGGECPVQVVLAGKAHPRDEEAKRSLQALFGLKHAQIIGQRVVFLDDYDLATGARLDARLRRVAEPAAPAAGGQRHQRDEGRDQRRRCSSACSTAGGRRPTTARTAGGSPATSTPTTTPRTSATLPRCTSARARGAARLLRARRAGSAGRWLQRMRASLRTLGPQFCATPDARVSTPSGPYQSSR